MWVLDEEDARMYAMHYRDFRHPGDEIDITQVNTSTGLWTDGEIMWVQTQAGLTTGSCLPTI